MVLNFLSLKPCVCTFFQLRKAHDDPVLTLDGTPIPVVEETKFLGVIFDKKTYVYTPYKEIES